MDKFCYVEMNFINNKIEFDEYNEEYHKDIIELDEI